MPVICSRSGLCVLLPFLVLTIFRPCLGQIAFTKIVDTSTPIPGGTGNFAQFDVPSLDNGNLGFRAYGTSSQQGIYTVIDGSLGLVANRNTPIPSGAGTFTGFTPLSFDGTSVAFGGSGINLQRGYYSSAGASLRIVADTNTPMPGGSGTFQWPNLAFGPAPSNDHGKVVFYGERLVSDEGPSERGLYVENAGALSVVLDHNTPAPSGPGILGVDSFDFAADSGNVGFHAHDTSSDQGGIYLKTGGSIRLVADASTPIPGGNGNFVYNVKPLSVSSDNMAFVGQGASGQEGIYFDDGSSLSKIVDKNTPVPGGLGTFTNFFALSMDGDNLAFWARDSLGHTGVYADIDGILMKIGGFGDILDGKIVTAAGAGLESLSANSVAFVAGFSDGSAGMYVATIPEPTTFILLGLPTLVVLRLYRRR